MSNTPTSPRHWSARDRQQRCRGGARTGGVRPKGGGAPRHQEGIALVMALTTVAILAVMLADMHEDTGTAFAVATAQRDALQAEYLAKSAINLTRLLVSAEPEIRRLVNPLYRALNNRSAPQLPVWNFADELLVPFCTPSRDEDEVLTGLEGLTGIDFSLAEGFENIPGACTVQAVAENGKININDPLYSDGDRAKTAVAQQLFALMGGYQSPSPYDELFAREDADGQFTSRLDIVSSVIDWWDGDTQRTDFDSGGGEIDSSGSEDNFYSRLDDSYEVKNAPFDSIEELRLIRGIGDDFWSTFIEPEPDDPDARVITIYASGRVNVNEAPAQVLWARVCSLVQGVSLCDDPLQAIKFIQLLEAIRVQIPIPLFSTPRDFLTFIEGRGQIYQTAQAFLGEGSELLFTPVSLQPAQRSQIARFLITVARIFTINATGTVGNSQVKLKSVVNFHASWTPPPPNAGEMPGLGIFHYYRVE